MEGSGRVEKQLDRDAHQREAEPHRDAIREAEHSDRSVSREEFGVDDAGEGEHEADLDVETDKELVGGRPGRRPQRRAVRGMQHHRVDDLVEPVGEPHGQSGRDDVEASALDLVGVGPQDEHEQSHRVPLELRRIAHESFGLQRRASVCGEKRHDHVDTIRDRRRTPAGIEQSVAPFTRQPVVSSCVASSFPDAGPGALIRRVTEVVLVGDLEGGSEAECVFDRRGCADPRGCHHLGQGGGDRVGDSPWVLDQVGVDMEAEVDSVAERVERDVETHLVEQDAGREDSGQAGPAHVHGHRRAGDVRHDRVHHSWYVPEHVCLVREAQERRDHEWWRGVGERAHGIRAHGFVHAFGGSGVADDRS